MMHVLFDWFADRLPWGSQGIQTLEIYLHLGHQRDGPQLDCETNSCRPSSKLGERSQLDPRNMTICLRVHYNYEESELVRL